MWGRDAERGAVVVHEGQAGGGVCGGAGDRGALGALEPPSAYPDDLGRGDPTAEVAGGGLLPLQGAAQEMAVSPLHHAEAAGGHARAQRQDRRLVAQVSSRPGRLLGRGEGPGGDVYRADGATYSTKGVSPHAVLWAACHVQGQEGQGRAHSADGGAGAVDQGDLSHRGAEDLS